MQKNSNFVKINKTIALICSAIVLITSIFVSNLLITRETNSNKSADNPVSHMYNQLKSYTPVENINVSEEPKMNNFEIQNANMAKFAPVVQNSEIAFSGMVTLLDALSGKTVTMALEDYVVHALAAEMPLTFDMQALMAQAVAIRTYTVRCALYGSKHKEATVCSDYKCCQSVIMPEKVDFDMSRAKYAVQATKGIVAVCDGVPILAAYHSSSVGATKSSEEVWGGALSYLVPVFAPESKEVSAKTVKIDKQKVKSVFLKNGLDEDFCFNYDSEGMCIGAVSGNYMLSAKRIKGLLGLRSDKFTVSDDGESLVFTSYGFGHGVGMSQYGADALAKDGYSFYEILKHYYTGISFAFLE